ncbi:hypothetical protein P9112_004759 [Eukaryota sp. TZLM1-RC]
MANLVSFISVIKSLHEQHYEERTDIEETSYNSQYDAFAKLQKRILKVFENLDFTVGLSLAKEKNPVFAKFLIDLKESSSSCLISQDPNVYGLLLNDHQWTTALRMRCFLWPCNENTFGKCRVDLITLGSDGVIKVVDVVTVDVCKDSVIDFAKKDETPLCFAEKSKIKKYNEPLSQLGCVEHVKYQLVPFAVSLFGNIGISGIKFLEGFRSLKERAGKELNFSFCHNRIVFSILKAIPEMLTKALLQLGLEYENRA